MGKEQAPAFQFYVKEWRSSRAVQRMSFAERGMYFEMLCEQWESFTLPDSPELCAELIGGTSEEWVRAWPALRRKFASDEPGRIYNVRLERARKERRQFIRSTQRIARAGGLARAQSAKRCNDGTYLPAVIQPPSSGPPAVIQRHPASASASASVLPPNPPAGGPMGRGDSRVGTDSATAEFPPGRSALRREGQPDLVVVQSVADTAARFLDRYVAMYAKARNGAFYALKPVRDHPYAMELVTAWPDLNYLEQMAELFLLKAEWKPKNEPGTIGQFKHMAPQCDALLRQHGHGPRG